MALVYWSLDYSDFRCFSALLRPKYEAKWQKDIRPKNIFPKRKDRLHSKQEKEKNTKKYNQDWKKSVMAQVWKIAWGGTMVLHTGRGCEEGGERAALGFCRKRRSAHDRKWRIRGRVTPRCQERKTVEKQLPRRIWKRKIELRDKTGGKTRKWSQKTEKPRGRRWKAGF